MFFSIWHIKIHNRLSDSENPFYGLVYVLSTLLSSRISTEEKGAFINAITETDKTIPSLNLLTNISSQDYKYGLLSLQSIILRSLNSVEDLQLWALATQNDTSEEFLCTFLRNIQHSLTNQINEDVVLLYTQCISDLSIFLNGLYSSSWFAFEKLLLKVFLDGDSYFVHNIILDSLSYVIEDGTLP